MRVQVEEGLKLRAALDHLREAGAAGLLILDEQSRGDEQKHSADDVERRARLVFQQPLHHGFSQKMVSNACFRGVAREMIKGSSLSRLSIGAASALHTIQAGNADHGNDL